MQTEFQIMLDQLGVAFGERTEAVYRRKFGTDWREEEHVTGPLLALVESEAERFAAGRPDLGLSLTAKLTKRLDENENGTDALIRFTCDAEEWQLQTFLLLQAKRQDPGKPLSSSDHARLRRQLDNMLSYTPESFVLIYTSGGRMLLVPALAAHGLRSRDLSHVNAIEWPRFWSGLLRGRCGDPVSERVPGGGGDWSPAFELSVHATLNRELPLTTALERM
ncbi:hypothetical protein ACFB49_22900 [Sphingomonas sp. DBB INV C78]|uniref:hypothetical protein n=1 Tax=Sphingomonas sp. DBB INV C78 TaxID=3349434 RepID=UPI0036D2A20D